MVYFFFALVQSLTYISIQWRQLTFLILISTIRKISLIKEKLSINSFSFFPIVNLSFFNSACRNQRIIKISFYWYNRRSLHKHDNWYIICNLLGYIFIILTKTCKFSNPNSLRHHISAKYFQQNGFYNLKKYI